jgi:hypothetical protein
MSRTTIIPTAQTKANQATDLYVPYGAGGSVTIPGALTVAGNLTVEGANVDLSGSTVIANVIGSATATITDTLNVGDPTDVGGGGAFIRGTLGDGTVYDSVYNRPGPTDYTSNVGQILVSIPTFPTVASGNYQVGGFGQFTPTRTGMYILEGTIGGSGYAWTAGLGDKMTLILTPTPVTPGVFPASAGTILMTPSSGTPTSWSSISCDKLVAGVTYDLYLDIENFSGTLGNPQDEITVGFAITQLC